MREAQSPVRRQRLRCPARSPWCAWKPLHLRRARTACSAPSPIHACLQQLHARRDRGRASRRRLRLDRPRARRRAPAEPDGQRARRRRQLAGAGRHTRHSPGARAGRDIGPRRPAAAHRPGCLRVRTQHRPSQPHRRPPPAQPGHPRGRPGSRIGAVLPAVFHHRRLPGPGVDRRDTGQWRREPRQRTARLGRPGTWAPSSA